MHGPINITLLLLYLCNFHKYTHTFYLRRVGVRLQDGITEFSLRHDIQGARGGAVGWGTALQAGMPRVRFLIVSLEFSINIILPAAIWPSASNRNEYQEYFLGGKGSRCVGLTTFPPSYADCLEIWVPHNLLEPSGPVQACNGIALSRHTVKFWSPPNLSEKAGNTFDGSNVLWASRWRVQSRMPGA